MISDDLSQLRNACLAENVFENREMPVAGPVVRWRVLDLVVRPNRVEEHHRVRREEERGEQQSDEAQPDAWRAARIARRRRRIAGAADADASLRVALTALM